MAYVILVDRTGATMAEGDVDDAAVFEAAILSHSTGHYVFSHKVHGERKWVFEQSPIVGVDFDA